MACLLQQILKRVTRLLVLDHRISGLSFRTGLPILPLHGTKTRLGRHLVVAKLQRDQLEQVTNPRLEELTRLVDLLHQTSLSSLQSITGNVADALVCHKVMRRRAGLRRDMPDSLFDNSSEHVKLCSVPLADLSVLPRQP